MTPKQAAEKLKSYGRNGDTELVHMTKGEVNSLRGLAQLAGGDLTTNPKTGQPEAFFLAALLPTLVGGIGGAMGLGAMGTAALGAGVGALMNRDDPLMGAISGGMGGFGGGQLASGLVGAGASAVNPAQLAAANAAADPIGALANSATQASAAGVAGPTGLGAFKAGLQNTVANPMHYVNQMGGGMKTLQAAGMAAAPLMHYQPKQRGGSGGSEYDGEMPEYDFNYNATGDTWRPGQGTYERTHFNPTFTRRFAEGGLAQIAPPQVNQPQPNPPQGMSGASAGAMQFLMGQGPSPVQQQQQAIAARQASATPMQPIIDRSAMPAGFLSGQGKYAERLVDDGFTFDVDSQRFIPRQRAEYTRVMPESVGGLAGEFAALMSSRTRGRSMRKGLFNPRRLAEGGTIGLDSGGFVIPADVTAYAGGGSTDAGQARLSQKLGAQPIRGPGDGLSDDIPTAIDGRQPARVANGEMYIPPQQVARVGKGDAQRGAKKLYAMLDNVRKQAVGHTKQAKRPNLDKALA